MRGPHEHHTITCTDLSRKQYHQSNYTIHYVLAIYVIDYTASSVRARYDLLGILLDESQTNYLLWSVCSSELEDNMKLEKLRLAWGWREKLQCLKSVYL